MTKYLRYIYYPIGVVLLLLAMVEFYDIYLTLQITDEEVDAYQDYWDH